MITEDPSGGTNNELAIERAAVDYALGYPFIYRTDDGRFLTLDEAWDELTPDLLAGLPAGEQVIDGGDVEALIFESGVFATIEVESQIVTQYSDARTRWTNDQLREQVFLTSDHGDLSFEDWLSAQVQAGVLKPVDVLQFVGYEDEDADEETVITERLIIEEPEPS
ncbi:MAG: hypothetical protein WCI74_08100 [Actinomycetes bacterium]